MWLIELAAVVYLAKTLGSPLRNAFGGWFRRHPQATLSFVVVGYLIFHVWVNYFHQTSG